MRFGALHVTPSSLLRATSMSIGCSAVEFQSPHPEAKMQITSPVVRSTTTAASPYPVSSVWRAMVIGSLQVALLSVLRRSTRSMAFGRSPCDSILRSATASRVPLRGRYECRDAVVFRPVCSGAEERRMLRRFGRCCTAGGACGERQKEEDVFHHFTIILSETLV